MKKLTLLLSAMLLACATNLWAETYTIEFLTGSNSNTAMTKDTEVSKVVAASSVDYVAGFTENCSKAFHASTSGVKLGNSSNGGTLEFTVADVCKANVTKITVKSVKYSSETPTISLYVNGGETALSSATSGTDVVHTFGTAQDVSTIKVVSSGADKKRAYIATIIIETTAADAPTLETLTVSGTLDKTDYEEGETIDPTGLVVTGTYSDGNSKPITNGIKWTFDPEVLATTTTAVQVVATVGTISSEAYSVPVTVTEHVVTPGIYSIDLNAGLYGVTAGNNGTEQTVTKNDITITSGCTSSAKSKTYYDASQIRYYADSYLKLAVPTGYDITKIVFTAGDKWDGSITASVGKYDNDSKTWTGGANSVDFSFAAQNRVKTIAVTYEKVLVVAPVLSTEDGKVAGGEFVEAFELTMVCATEDATIFYTLDESDPKTSETAQTYTSPITISETTTVRAIAKAGEDWSREATETYTKLVALTTMDEIFATATEAGSSKTTTKYVTFNDWVVTGVKGSNAYLTDGTKGLIIYTSSHGFEASDVLSGTVSCDITLYNGSAEIKGLKATTTGLTITKGGTAPVQSPAIKDLSPINTGSIISLSNLTYNGSVLKDADDNAITPYDTFITLPIMTSGKKYNVKGVYIDFKGTKEIAPLAESDIQEVTTPSAIESAAVEMPAVKTIENGQLIILRDGVKYNAMGVRLQ